MRLAILGASARAAASSAIDAGFEVVAADLFADSDLRERCPTTRIEDWPNGFAGWLDDQQVQGWLYTGGLENHPALVDRLATSCPLLGNSGESLRLCRNPEALARLFAAADAPFPKVRTSPPNDGDPWLIKSRTSAGGLGVDDWRGGEAGSNDYWQARVAGRAISAAYLAADGEVELLGVTEQLIARGWTGARRYQYAGSIGPLAVSASTRRDIRSAGAAVAAGCQLLGLFGIDFVEDPAGRAWPVEVNPRFTASMEIIERWAGRSLVADHVDACLHYKTTCWGDVQSSSYCGKVYLFAVRDIRAAKLDASDLRDVPTPGTPIAQGQPICTVLAQANGYDGVEPELLVAASRVRRQIDESQSD